MEFASSHKDQKSARNNIFRLIEFLNRLICVQKWFWDIWPSSYMTTWRRRIQSKSNQVSIFEILFWTNVFCDKIQWHHNFSLFSRAKNFPFKARHNRAKFSTYTTALKIISTILLYMGKRIFCFNFTHSSFEPLSRPFTVENWWKYVSN